MKMNDKYNEFIKKYNDKKVLFLEFGVGFNTPSIIRFPFERLVYMNKNSYLIRFNKKYYEIDKSIKNRSIGIKDNIEEIINKLVNNNIK